MLWRKASPEEKGVYEKLAEQVCELHRMERISLLYGKKIQPILLLIPT